MSGLDYHDPEWVAEKLDLERNTVYKYLQEGMIPAVRVGKKWLISESKLAEWLEAETGKQTSKRQMAAESADRLVGRMQNYSAAARELIRLAHSEARRYGHHQLGQEHLVLAMAQCGHLKAEAEEARSLFEKLCEPGEGNVPKRLGRSDDARKAMRLASSIAGDAGASEIEPSHILRGILGTKEGNGYRILLKLGIAKEKKR